MKGHNRPPCQHPGCKVKRANYHDAGGSACPENCPRHTGEWFCSKHHADALRIAHPEYFVKPDARSVP